MVLGLDRLVSTRPDVVFGLDPLRIAVSPGPSSKLLFDPGKQVQLYAASIKDLVVNLGDGELDTSPPQADAQHPLPRGFRGYFAPPSLSVAISARPTSTT